MNTAGSPSKGMYAETSTECWLICFCSDVHSSGFSFGTSSMNFCLKATTKLFVEGLLIRQGFIRLLQLLLPVCDEIVDVRSGEENLVRYSPQDYLPSVSAFHYFTAETSHY